MSGIVEQQLQNLDKQTLILLLRQTMASNAGLQKTVDQLNANISLLTEEVRSLRMHRFGRSSESNLTGTDGQMSFAINEDGSIAFNEAESVTDAHPEIQEPEMQDIHYKRKKPAGKREENLDGLPSEPVYHEMTEEQLLEVFPDGKWKRLPDVVYKRLEYLPASTKVLEHHVAVYAGADNQTIVKADRPADLFRNSVATPSLVAGILNCKFVNSEPVARLSRDFENHDIFISTQVMCNWVILSANRYMRRLYDRMKEKLFSYHVIHADETPVQVNRDGRPAGAKSYMWVYRSGALEDNPFVLYEYQKTRKADHPREFLKGFHGFCVTDGYQVYHLLDQEREDLNVAGCWSHALRGFSEVVKTLGKEKAKGTSAYKALQIIQTICEREKSYKTFSPEERLDKRTSEVAPLVDAFFAYIRSESLRVTPKSLTGKSITYCLNQEKYLRVFLTDGLVPIDNNAAERSIRTFCLGKKNWYVIDTISGAQASAIHYSIAESARANDLKPYEYFKYVLTELPKHKEFEDPSYLDELLPWSKTLPDTCYKKQPSKVTTTE